MAVVEIGLQIFGRDAIVGTWIEWINSIHIREPSTPDEIADGARVDIQDPGHFVDGEVLFVHDFPIG